MSTISRSPRGRPLDEVGARAGSRRTRPGSARQTRSRVARKLAVRASSRPKKSSTKRRATCVESTRSVAAWKVPTFSAREWRSAADDALGANGSCTCTKSNGAASSSDSIVRETSIGSETLPPLAAEHALADRQHAARSRRSANTRLRVLAAALDRRARLAHELPRLRGRDHHHPVAAAAQLVGDPLDEAVDLVVLLPGVRRDLGDGEALRRHVPPERYAVPRP